MTEKIKNKLKLAYEYCEANDKSSEFLLQYMQDFVGVSQDMAIRYLIEQKIFK